MPYALGVAGGESAGKRVGERKKREPEGEEEADSGPRIHLLARESTVRSGTTSVFFKFRIHSKFTVSSVEIPRFHLTMDFSTQCWCSTL